MADHGGGRGQADLGDPFPVVAGPVPVRGPVLAAVGGLADGQDAFHAVRDQEPADEEQQGERDPEHLGARGVHGLRQQVEAHDAEHQPAGQAQHEVAAVGDALRRPSACQGHQERTQRHDHGHVPLHTDSSPPAHFRARVADHGRLTAAAAMTAITTKTD